MAWSHIRQAGKTTTKSTRLLSRWMAVSRRRLPLVMVVATVASVAVLGVRLGLAGQTPGGAPGAAQLAPGGVDQNSGQFTTSIPIEVPAFHGVEPKLALTYNSSAEEGAFGLGWRLSGSSVIERVGPGRGSATMTGSDHMLLDGEPLVPSTALGGTYVVKRQTFQRITFDAKANVWTVTERDGTVATYAKAFAITTGQTVRWMLTSVADLHGNTVTYTNWCHGSSDCYLNKVSYNGTVVTFYRESRTDPILRAVGGKVETGGFTQTSMRVKTIDVTVSGARARAYQLGYTASATTGRSLLASVRRWGSNTTMDATGTITGGSALKPIALTYRADTKTFTASPEFSSYCSITNPYGTGDFNGDGKADLWCYVSSQARSVVAIGDGAGGFSIKPPFDNWCYNKFEFGVFDVNGDGRDDLWCHGTASGDVEYAIGDGAGGFAPAVSKTRYCPIRSSTLQTGLFGRGVFGDSSQEGLWCHRLGQANSTVIPQNSTLNSPCGILTSFGSGDFDGDGRSEFWCFAPGTNANPRVFTSETATAAPPIVLPTGSAIWCTAGTQVGAADFNGDGRSDLWCREKSVSTTRVALSDGTSRFRLGAVLAKWCGATAGMGTGDFNGDGKDDLWCRDPATGNVWVATAKANGTSFTPSAMTRMAWCVAGNVGVADFNGDGKDDLWCHGAPGKGASNWVALSGTAGLPDVLTGITNELGGVTQVVYRPASVWPVGTLEAGLQLALGGWVTVSQVKVGDGRGNFVTTNYSYSSGRWDPVERRFLGFEQVTAADASGAKSVTNFRTLAGYPTNRQSQVSRYGADGTLLERIGVSYSEAVASNVYRSLVSAQSHAWCQGATTCQRTRTDYVSYDGYGNVTEQREQGDVAVAGDETTVSTVYSYATDSYLVDRPSSITTLSGLGTTGTRLKRVEFDHNAVGDPKAARTWWDTTNTLVPASLTFDSYGNKTSATNELGKVTSWQYDATYHLYPIRECVGSSTCDSTVCTTTGVLCSTRTFNATFGGQPASYQDVNGKLTSWQYDVFGRQKLESRPDGGTTSTSYVSWGDPANQYVQTAISDGSTDGLWTRMYPDGLGRAAKTVAESGTTVLTTYNGQGQVAKVSNPFTGTATPQYTSYGYDALGRPTGVTHPDQAITTTTYGVLVDTADADFATAKLVVKSCDERQFCRRVGYDGGGQPAVTSEWSGVPGATGVVEYRTRTGYDLLGRVKKITDSVGNVTSFGWDSLGRKTSMTDPDSGSWTYSYDEAGHLTSQKDGAGNTITFDYADAFGRLTSRKSGTTVLASYFYDEANHGAGLGRMTRMTDTSGSTSWSYDAMGRISGLTRTIDGVSFTVSQTFDTAGRLSTLTYPDGEVVNHTYGADGCLTTVGAYVTAATCTPLSTSQTLGNGVVYTRNLNAKRGWLDSDTATYGTTTLQKENYTYYNDGRVKAKTSDDTADQWTYGYDALGRLTTATNTGNSAYSSSYGYDQVGRMTSGTGLGTITYPAVGGGHAHAPSTVGGVANSYDAAGNLKTDGTHTFAYNALNQLSSATVGTTTTTYRYDGLGVRVQDGAVRLFELDGRLLYQNDSATGTATKFYFYGDQPIAAKKVGGTAQYYIANHLGSAHLILDSARAVVAKTIYSPYGKVLVQTGTTTDPHGLAGDYFSSASGLYQRGIRDQDATRAWFTTPDPSGNIDPAAPQSLNRYSYAAGDPVNLVDHTGKAPWHASALFGGPVKATGGLDIDGTATLGVNVGVVSASYSINPAAGTTSYGAGVRLSQVGIATLTGSVKANFTNGDAAWTSTSVGLAAKAGVDGAEAALKSTVDFSFDEDGNLVSHTTMTAEAKVMEILEQSVTLYEHDTTWTDNGDYTRTLQLTDVRQQREWSLAYSDEEQAQMRSRQQVRHDMARSAGLRQWFASMGMGTGFGFGFGLNFTSYGSVGDNVWFSGTSFGIPNGWVEIGDIIEIYRR